MPNFETVRFGNLVYRDQDVVNLPAGLVGMPDLRNWLLLDMEDNPAMKWFQSLDRGDFGFPVTQPYFFLEDYEFELPQGQRERITNRSPEDLAVMIITTVHPGGARVTGNMLAPLVFDTSSRKGVQLTLDGDFDMRQELNYFKFGLAVQTPASENGRQEPDGEPKAEVPGESRADAAVAEPVSV